MTGAGLCFSGLSERLSWHNLVHIADPGQPPFTYTSGLAQRPGRAYELAVTGLGLWLAQQVLTKTAEQLVDDTADPADGMELDRVLGGRHVRLRPAQDATALPDLPPGTAVWQVLTPDKWGRFPGDPHYSLPGWPQPLL